MRDNLRQLPDKLPASFGRYRLVKLLGKGGMGSVYLAHDSQLDRSVALKVPQLDEDANSPIRERFLTEARAAAALNHPHICRIHDVGEVDGVPYLTMAYIEGKPLNELARLRPLLHRQSALLVWKVAVALHEAHKRGIIHRDLKPANIMIDKRGEPSIMDFGVARRAGKGDARITQTGEIMGTPAYKSPEQIQGNLDAIGPASDVYSLGVILYELLAGRLPFTGDIMVILSRVLLDDPPPPSRFCHDLALDLEEICLMAMAKQTKHRYASMAEFAAALFDHLHQQSTSTQTTTRAARDETQRPASDIRVSQLGGLRSMAQVHAQLPAARKSDSTAPRRRRRRGRRQGFPLWPVLAGAGAVLIVVLLLLWLVSRGRDLGRNRAESVSASVREEEKPNPPPDPTPRADDPPKKPPVAEKGPPAGEKSPLAPPGTFRSRMGIEFVLVPRGKSWLGGGAGIVGRSEVEIPYDFYLGKYEVTQEEWLKVMGSTFSAFRTVPGVSREDLKRFPFAGATKADARSFVRRLNGLEKEPGWEYRLPTEKEWEYACRGGPMTDRRESAYDYYLKEPANRLQRDQANYGNVPNRPVKVGSFPPNWLGLYDMHGNVWEWCHDTLFDAKGAELEVRRGGCFFFGDKECRAAFRYVLPKLTNRYPDNGLRVARVPAGKEP